MFTSFQHGFHGFSHHCSQKHGSNMVSAWCQHGLNMGFNIVSTCPVETLVLKKYGRTWLRESEKAGCMAWCMGQGKSCLAYEVNRFSPLIHRRSSAAHPSRTSSALCNPAPPLALPLPLPMPLYLSPPLLMSLRLPLYLPLPLHSPCPCNRHDLFTENGRNANVDRNG